MKHPITFRLDPDLLRAARQCANAENRSLTNFIETILKQHVGNAATHSEMPLTEPRSKPAVAIDAPFGASDSFPARPR